MSRYILSLATAIVFAFSVPATAEQPTRTYRDADLKQLVNKGTVGVVSGGISGTYVRIAADLASVLDNGFDLRVVPMIGKGSVQNVTDILYLKGTDIGIVQSDVLTFIKDEGIHPGIDTRIHYITKLYNEEFHLVANTSVRSVEDLAGRKVNFGNAGSGTEMTSKTVFKALGIEVEPTTYDYELALQKVRSGEIAAMVYVAGKPVNTFVPIGADDSVHLLPIAYEGALQDSYLPSRFTAEDYPGLVPQDAPVDTIAVGAVMAVFNWSPGSFRYNKVAGFVEAMFDSFAEFQKAPRHEKWREVNLGVELPGWTRFRAASEWLAEHEAAPAAAERAEFQEFVAEHADQDLDPTDMEDLFKQFLAWRESSGRS